MKRTSLLKDALREIKKSYGRFLSVLIIIALGCGFFTGLKATRPDMIITAEDYFEKSCLMDLRLRSGIGVKAADIAAVRSADNVKGACAGYSKDLYYFYDGQNVVLKAFSINPEVIQGGKNDLNRLTLVSGRMPKAKNECVVEKKMSSPDTFEIGNSLTLSEPDIKQELSASLAFDTFEIVGVVLSPEYIGYQRDHTTVGNGTVISNIYLPEEAFVCDYYTDLYVSLDGLDGLDPFSEEYEKAVEKQGKAAVEAFEQSVTARYDKLKSDAQNKIASAEMQVENAKSVLSCDNDRLEELYGQAVSAANQYEREYEAVKDQKGSRKYLVQAQLVQAREKAQMIRALADDTDGSVRAEYEAQLEQAVGDIETAKTELESAPQLRFYHENRFSSNDYSAYKDDAEKIDNVSKAFPLFFILIAALVCLTAMTRMVEEQRTLIGTYKALGYSGFRILSKYLMYSLPAAAVGSCAGSAVGMQVFPRLIIGTYRILYNIPGAITPFRPWYMAAALAASLILTSAAVIYAIARELKAQPSEIMRPKAPPDGRRVILEKLPFIWNRLGFLMKVTVRNLLRYKKRFFMTLVGISGCTALIITGFGLSRSVTSIIDLQFTDVFKFSATAALNTDKDEPFKALDGCKNVTDYDPAVSFASKAGAGGESVSVTVIVPRDSLSGFVNMVSPDGESVKLQSGGVVITEKLADMCGISVGDKIEFTDEEQQIKTAKVTGIMKNYALSYIYMPKELYTKISGRQPEYNIAIFTSADGADEDEVKKELISDERILGVSFNSDSTAGFERSAKSMNKIALMLIVCAAFLSITVLYNLSDINITERRREIATIKVLGFFDKETSAYIYRENIISTVIGIAAGLPLGRLLHYFVIVTVEVDSVMFNRSLDPWAYILGAAFTAVFTLTVNIALHFKLKKIGMTESLKSVE
ncbi:MAG: FtsX-like permease family protein [Oscillospiraceae bacterium]